MPFTTEERQSLLALKGVGPTVLSRLESLGYGSFAQLRQANALDIASKASALTGCSCCKSSPQARAAIPAGTDAARLHPAQESEAIR